MSINDQLARLIELQEQTIIKLDNIEALLTANLQDGSPQQNRFFSIAEYARNNHKSRTTIYDMIARNELKFITKNGKTLVSSL